MKHDQPTALRGAEDGDEMELLTRELLITRWRCGSDAFFWRAERAGRLIPYRSDGLTRYAWTDVFLFEGGLPPAGLEQTYRRDLLTDGKVASLCACSRERILEKARTGELATRRIGRKYRFVAAEVARWQATSWSRGR